MAGPVAAAFGFGCVEKDQVFAAFGSFVVFVGGVEIGEEFFWIFLCDGVDPKGGGDFVGGDEFDLSAFEEGHWEIAGEVHGFRVLMNGDWECVDQIFTVVAVVEGAGAEEDGDWGFD